MFTPHPIWDREWPPLDDAQIRALMEEPDGEGALAQYVEGHERRLKLAAVDPLRHGFELPHWPDLWHMIGQKSETFNLGANGSGKTEYGGRLVNKVMGEKRGAKVLCVATNDESSVTYQQAAVYTYLPKACRDWNTQVRKRRGSVTKINWSQAGGFTENTLVWPNRSQCWFKTVAQYLRDPISFEGPSYDLVWLDEGGPLPLIDTLRFRVGKVGGKIFFTFTAVHGYDATCASVLDGARIIKTLPMQWDWLADDSKLKVQNSKPEEGNVSGGSPEMTGGSPVPPGKGRGAVNPALTFPELSLDEVQVKGCPAGHMPYIMQPLDFAQGVIFTWCHWNPFLPTGGRWNPKMPALFDKCVGRAKWQVRVRLFGWVEKLAGCRIANFDPNVHVIPHERIEKLLKEGRLTTYMAADPATARSYFLAWKGVDADGNEYLFDESPRITEGEWVAADGAPGDGQKVFAGMGSNWYKRHIREREREHGIEAEKRFGDPRAFATAAAHADGGVNLFELFGADGEQPEEEAMTFYPAKIRQTVDMDLEMVVTKLAYDTQRPLTPENQPRLYISDRCQNIVRCWLNWDGKQDSPFKDGVDAPRYLFCEETPYQDPNVPAVVGGGGWGRMG